MAVYGNSAEFLDMLGLDIATNPNSITLTGYMNLANLVTPNGNSPTYAGQVMINYLINNGVDGNLTVEELVLESGYFAVITKAMEIFQIIKQYQEATDIYNQWCLC